MGVAAAMPAHRGRKAARRGSSGWARPPFSASLDHVGHERACFGKPGPDTADEAITPDESCVAHAVSDACSGRDSVSLLRRAAGLFAHVSFRCPQASPVQGALRKHRDSSGRGPSVRRERPPALSPFALARWFGARLRRCGVSRCTTCRMTARSADASAMARRAPDLPGPR